MSHPCFIKKTKKNNKKIYDKMYINPFYANKKTCSNTVK